MEKHLKNIFIIAAIGIAFSVPITKTWFNNPNQQPDVIQLKAKNEALAKQYRNLASQHKKLNQQYLLKHGYSSASTKTDGELFITSYHSESKTKYEIHTPKMVKIELKQSAIKTKFNHNNDRLVDKGVTPINLTNHQSYQEVTTAEFNNLTDNSMPKFFSSCILVLCTLIIIVNSIQYINAKKHV